MFSAMPRILELCTSVTGLLFTSDPSCSELYEIASGILCAAIQHDQRVLKTVSGELMTVLSDATMATLSADTPKM